MPLVNIVFLLLIFFMLAGRLAASDPFEVVPPQSASEGPAEVEESVLLVGADGRMALDGKVMDDVSMVKYDLRDRLADGQRITLRLKADGRADAVVVVGVMEELREAGIKTLKLLTVPEGR